LSKVVFGGAQDTGTPVQSSPGSLTWSELPQGDGMFLQGDGGVVAVDADQTAHPGTTLRYASFHGLLNFNRSTWNAANTMIGMPVPVGLNIVSGLGAGMTLFQADQHIQFYNPYALNAIDPSRMLIGTQDIYESPDHGDHLNNLVQTGQFIGGNSFGFS